jgi:hypothetical protein
MIQTNTEVRLGSNPVLKGDYEKWLFLRQQKRRPTDALVDSANVTASHVRSTSRGVVPEVSPRAGMRTTERQSHLVETIH